MLIDEIYLRDGTNMVPVDSIEGEMIEDIVLDGMTCHFAKQNDVGGQSIVVCDNAVEEPFISVEAIGNTTQPTYTGKNLFDASGEHAGIYGITSRADGKIASTKIASDATTYIRFSKTYPAGTYTVSAKKTGDEGVSARLLTTAKITGSTWNAYYGAYYSTFIPTTSNGESITFTTTSEFQIGFNFNKTSTGGTNIELYDIQLEKASTATEYEQYVGGKVSPNAFYPQPMVNAGNNGMTLTVKSHNLLNKQNFASKALREETVATLHATQVMSNAQVNAMLKPNTTYTISYEVEGVEGRPSGATQNSAQGFLLYTKVSKVSWIYMTTNRIAKPGEIIKMTITFTTPANFYDCGFQMWAYSGNYTLSGASTGTVAKCIFRKVQIVEGSTAKPYEPYFEPTTIDIPSSITVGSSTIPLRMAKVEKADNIVVKDGEVIYNRNIAYLRVPHATKTYTYSTGYYYGVEFGNIAEQTLSRAKGISTHTTHVGDNPGNNIYDSFWVGVNTTIVYWIGILHTLGFNKLATKEEQVAAFNAWLDEQEANGTPVELIYQRKTPETKDITNTDLGRQLLALAASKGTNYLEITGDASLGVSYWRQVIPNEEI